MRRLKDVQEVTENTIGTVLEEQEFGRVYTCDLFSRETCDMSRRRRITTQLLETEKQKTGRTYT